MRQASLPPVQSGPEDVVQECACRSILLQSQSPPEKMEDMADEVSWVHLTDDSLQSSKQLASEYSISSLVNTTCSLTNIMAEENCDTILPNRFYWTLAKNDALFQKNRIYRWKSKYHPQVCYSRRLSLHLTLPRFPLRRRWSELALPTFMTEPKVKKGQEGADMKAENAANKSSEATKMEDITYTNTNLDVLEIVEDINEQKDLEGDVPDITQNNTTCSDINHLNTRDILYAVSPPSPSQHENDYEIVEDVMRRVLPSKSPDEQLQKAPIAANKHTRRGCKCVKGKIKNLFVRLSCCLPTRSKEYTTSSILLQSQSPPEKVEDMADEVSWVHLTDDSLQSSKQLASEYSISSLVNTTCSLTNIVAEENCDTILPNRFYWTLAKNDALFQKNHIYRWKSKYHPQVCYSRRLSLHLTLPRFPLRRRWSELALPTFMTEPKVKKGQEGADMKSLETPKSAENAANLTSEGTHKDAKVKATRNLFRRFFCCLCMPRTKETTSSILLQSQSPPEKVEDMADEVSWVHLTDDSLQSSKQLASEYSISSLVNTTCSLTNIVAEENCDTILPNRFYWTLAKNDALFQKNHIYRWKSKYHPQVCYSRRLSLHLTLPRFPLRRRWSELALPTFMTEPKVKKGQEGADMKSLETPKSAENAANLTSEGTHKDAKVKATRNLFRRFFCCLCMPRTKETTSSILLQSQSPPEKVEDMADEVSWVHLTDDSLQSSKQLASEYSISSLVNTTCSLTNIVAEENCDTILPNRFYWTLAKNDALFQKNRIYRWKSKYHPQVCYSRRLSLHLTLPRFPLRRRWSELALPTFMTEPKVKKGQEGADMKSLETPKSAENAANLTSEGTHKDAKVKATRNLFRRFFCCLCMPRTKETTSSILLQSQSPPEKVEDMADEVSWVHLTDDSLQSSKQLASEYSISSLVNTTCSLTNIVAEENCDTILPNRFYWTLAKNDALFQKNRIYRWKSKYHPQVCYSRRLSLHLTLPRFPLRRRWSELALPTFMTEPKVKKGQEGADMKSLETPKSAENAANLTSEGTHKDAKVKATRNLFRRFFCCLCMPRTKETTSSILLQSQSPPEKVEDMADEVSWVHLTDDSLQSSKQLASEYSISSLVNTTCSLTNIVAEENCDTILPNRFYWTLAKNDALFQKNRIYRWKSKYHPQVCYSRRLSLHLTLPRFPLRRRWSELALPTFMTEPKVKKGQEGADMKSLETPKSAENAANLTSEGTHKDAKVKATRNLFRRFFCCLCMPRTKETTSSILLQSQSPPEKVEDMADEVSWVHLTDDSLQSSKQLASEYSISSLVNTTCSLTNIVAEENCDTILPNRFYWTLAKNDALFQKNRIYRWKSKYHPQVCYSRRLSLHLTLPRFPLRRRWSELALPTFMTEPKVKKGQEGADMKSLETPKSAENAANLTSEGTHKDAKVKATRNLFRRFFCCLCMPRTKETTSRADDAALTRDS
ncbi:uncharacterized protein LOC130865096 isoform X2 [Chionomys nivalis]|uniref:uncharacterized protein LOC130865096 isoform X2 n=1 Tax=Chionomys nivalis TaxID=269649 RepID=UPI0025964140|nr:uncharacterized protein LOC130865096 isoform X2 [Chionomys nivalis]XP_057611958.1 uncharacterized protein LOC130865096 isoform X2 [Chionomys nivalis]